MTTDRSLPLVGFSRALYSNWLLHTTLQVVVDAGEGLQLGLGRRVYVPTHMLITHGHADHMLGLPGFVAARRFSRGAQDKPLVIAFPEGLAEIEIVRDTIARLWPQVDFPLTWHPVTPGARIPLTRNRDIDVFQTSHQDGKVTVGYAVAETRRRLRPEYAALPQSQIETRARAGGREAIIEEYRHILFAHTGDTMALAPALFARADLLVHDATFLDEADRRWDIHATTKEAIAIARDAGVKCLVLHHLSVRYERQDLLPRIRKQVEELHFEGECWLLDDAELARVR
jgi:ribonuclease Z